MATILYIKANAKPEGQSRTFRISDKFIEAYKQNNKGDEVITLDLYKEKINFLSEGDINSIFGEKAEDARKHPILKYAYQFSEADKYVIAAPMWNFSVPAILKAYIDYISVSGITFKYTDKGAVGLCQGKKAVYIVTRGAEYSKKPFTGYEMGSRYLKTFLSFLGITDFTTIAAEKMDVIGEDVEKTITDTINKAVESAKSF